MRLVVLPLLLLFLCLQATGAEQQTSHLLEDVVFVGVGDCAGRSRALELSESDIRAITYGASYD